jgi:hypothetical protein
MPRRCLIGLASFIKSREDDIIDNWESFARSLLPAAAEMDSRMLRDHIRWLLRFIVKDLGASQSGQADHKSTEYAPEMHGEDRFRDGFDLIQLHAEFRALRSSILKLWTKEWSQSNREWITPADVIPDLIRFNEIIDKMLSKSLEGYLEARKVMKISDEETPERMPPPN